MAQMFRLVVACVVLSALPATAAVVHFVNGDRLTGTLTNSPAGSVAIDVPHVGVVVVPSAQVARVVPAKQPAAATEPASAAETSERTSAWEVRSDLGLVVASGNTRTQDMNLVSAAQRTGDVFDNVISLAVRRANAQAGAEGRITRTKDHVDVKYDLRWKYDESWYAVANFQFFRDPIKQLNRRYTTGVGLGHTLWDEQRGTFKTDFGISQVFEAKEGAGIVSRSDAPALRWSLTFKHWLRPESLEIFHNNELLRILAPEHGTVWDSDTGLRYHLNSRWHAGLRLDIEHETRPAVGRARTDASYAIDLGVKM